MTGLSRTGTAFVVFLILGVAPAAAEPQILGLIASLEPVTLQCLRGKCSAEFSFYCIERDRKAPINGDVYTIYDPATLTIEGVRADGTTIVLALDESIKIASSRGRSAIEISLPSYLLRTLNLASVRVSVGEYATLIPETVANARRPHTPADIALATGPMRVAAAAIIDHGGKTTNAALLTAQLVNQLPRGGRASEAQRDSLWQTAGLSPTALGLALVEACFERCYDVTRSGMMSLRQCLGSLHDRLISELNVKYWKAVETGS